MTQLRLELDVLVVLFISVFREGLLDNSFCSCVSNSL
jgi:hypothetical protein